MTEALADTKGRPTEELNRLYECWSKGGTGLLITGNIQVDRRYVERPGNVVSASAPGSQTTPVRTRCELLS